MKRVGMENESPCVGGVGVVVVVLLLLLLPLLLLPLLLLLLLLPFTLTSYLPFGSAISLLILALSLPSLLPAPPLRRL